MVRILLILTVVATMAFSGGCKTLLAAEQDRFSNKMSSARQVLRQSFLRLRTSPDALKTFFQEASESNGTSINNEKNILESTYQDLLPLLENSLLDTTAQTLCENVLSGGLERLDSNVTNTLLKEADYNADKLNVAATGVMMKEYIDPADAAELLFTNFAKSISQELRDKGKAAFLQNDFLEIGVGYCGGVAALSETEKVNSYLLILIIAHALGPQPQWIQCGHVYHDVNYNYQFDAGEGLRGVLLTDDNGTLLAKTLSNGQFCFRRPKGDWTLYIESFPFTQDYWIYSNLLEKRNDGILWHDYQLPLSQDVIDTHRKSEQAQVYEE